MNDDKDYKKGPTDKKPSEGGVIIDATAHRRPRVHGPEIDHRKDTIGIEFLADVPLQVNVVLAQTVMSLGEILALGTDSVVQLNKPSGDPVDIYVGTQKLGRGEVIVLQEKLRVRVVEITPLFQSTKESEPSKPEEK